MNRRVFCFLIAGALGLVACDTRETAVVDEDRTETGSHGGRLLTDGELELELAIFETGRPPEFRAWTTRGGQIVDPKSVDLQVVLTRLGGDRDFVTFSKESDYLKGDIVVREPHSFSVEVEALLAGQTHRWRYDSFEGRTRIDGDVALAAGLETQQAGPATIAENITVYGRVVANSEKTRAVSARFPGMIESVVVSIGDFVSAGQILAVVESNESLKNYEISAPIEGVITERLANPGEQTDIHPLFMIMDTSEVWADFSIFPQHRGRVRPGVSVTILSTSGESLAQGVVTRLNVVAEVNQSILARVVLANDTGNLVPGMNLSGEIRISEHTVPLAVRRTGLQRFRDFTVVYEKVGDDYEVRMLDLGRQDEQWAEVLGGLTPGAEYVTTNSYLIKADIEKSGASHDH